MCRQCYTTHRSQPTTKLNALHNTAKLRALKLGKPFNITVPFLHKLFYDKQNRKCGITNAPLLMSTHSDFQASLDRINDASGYTEDNVRFTALEVNTSAKWSPSFLQQVRHNFMLDETKSKSELTSLYEKWDVESSINILYNRAMSKNNQRNKIRLKNCKTPLLFDITPRFLELLWYHQRGLCFYSNVPMSGKSSRSPYKMSIERRNVAVGYTRENTVLICLAFNSTNVSNRNLFYNKNIHGDGNWTIEKVCYILYTSSLSKDQEVLNFQQYLQKDSEYINIKKSKYQKLEEFLFKIEQEQEAIRDKDVPPQSWDFFLKILTNKI